LNLGYPKGREKRRGKYNPTSESPDTSSSERKLEVQVKHQALEWETKELIQSKLKPKLPAAKR
jgi:hypothetical protein